MIKNLQELRKKGEISQEYLAKYLDISRPTLERIEKGERDITISQAKKLARLFELSLEELISGKSKGKIEVVFEGKDQNQPKEGVEIRISVPQKKLKKFKEALLYILEKVGSKPNVGMTVIYKLLYFIDFDYYEKFEEQIIGATYIKNHFGPTPVEFKKIVEMMEEHKELESIKSKYFDKEQKKYLPLRRADVSVFSGEEIKHIDDVLSRFADRSAKDLSDYSHKDVPWIAAEDGEKIDYESVFYRTRETSVREYED
ncbi:TPA: DUF4065 domain-containing protein [Candidatus Wolfebacteria bacterium]|uniref:HTH cro/C1-type domain-containing protein n=2 Tax=Candidatus Wolfeibacteriota TaxID=1752735 RepID=A0A0G1WJ80_9BACT|nr:MAG: helix-turN-helix domain protein [Candidatus Wolfebacteria bacterium GW2011_GWB1_47_1]KKU40965.1 MAG: hypothetical protein UX58_C0012G0012 [Candidatus Wolfebacteria bacterium GW2011_GWB2_46_69]KKU53136.1 MAG: hypothetical protein UX76_C0021G0002 [Candidatus Wolfebacteria bacterium GW2011_GWC1_47_103]KKU59735.1 MAG: hypothetical protein UX83_C0002G0022 [Candidatus Wolfebacteria bacterium GW2011_GWE2_47_12]KKU65726.1 MAG: hypothetical protein UX90_C0002G0102 [Candidatus Wolfebacteria bacte